MNSEESKVTDIQKARIARMAVKDHKDLVVWQKSMALVKSIYEITADFPKNEMYGLTSQMRRAAVSIPSNIAEGAGRGTTREYAQFVSIAVASATELQTLCLIAVDLGFAASDKMDIVKEAVDESLSMLVKLRETLRAKI